MKMFAKGHPYAYSLQSIRDYVHWYYTVMDVLKDKLPERTRVVSYEQIVTTPDRVRADLGEFCGLQATENPIPDLGNDCECAEPYPQY